jgi:hypothetical protein
MPSRKRTQIHLEIIILQLSKVLCLNRPYNLIGIGKKVGELS